MVKHPSVIAKRLGALILTGILISVVAPVLAEENSPSSSVDQAAPSPDDSSMPVDTPTVSDTPTTSQTSIPSSIPSAQSSDTSTSTVDTQTASPSPTPAAPLASQVMRLDLPTNLSVDPRALSKTLPAINIAGPEFVLACISSPQATLDLYAKNSQDSIFYGKHLVSGDLTQRVLLSGSTAQVEALINSYNGLRIVSLRGSISSAVVRFEVVAMSKPSLEASFCSHSVNTRTLTFRPLGLGMDLIKNGLTLKK